MCVLLAAAVGLLLYKGLLSSLDYFDTVDQALDHRAQLGTSVIRLEGVVDCGTVGPDLDGDLVLDQRRGRPDASQVRNTGTPPDLFQPSIPVVVVGRFASVTSPVFDSEPDHGEAHRELRRRAPRPGPRAHGTTC